MKLQPNFSWQKYEGAEQNQKEQFQYQLQQQHILVANTTNSTIDDSSYFARNRMTGFTWTTGQAIWKKTISGVIVGSAVTAYPHGLTNIDIVTQLQGTAQDAIPMQIQAIPLPYIDPTTLANGVGIFVDNTDLWVNAANGNWTGYIFSVTIYYTQTISAD